MTSHNAGASLRTRRDLQERMLGRCGVVRPTGASAVEQHHALIAYSLSISRRGLPFTDAVVGKLQFASGRVLHSGSMQLQQNGGRREDPVCSCGCCCCCCATVRCLNHSLCAAGVQLVSSWYAAIEQLARSRGV